MFSLYERDSAFRFRLQYIAIIQHNKIIIYSANYLYIINSRHFDLSLEFVFDLFANILQTMVYSTIIRLYPTRLLLLFNLNDLSHRCLLRRCIRFSESVIEKSILKL